jgi:hypothetical protein
MESKQLGLVLLVVGLAAVNLIYLADLLAGDGFIVMGVKSWGAVVVANAAAIIGLVMLNRAGSGSVDEG